ncbi:hypothetical protein K461DRAFT_309312 [Myriangium duriaei CBS 260.36]|uniref:Uncharacterized protein n=1 Tax=Myriangium duriaei CBS 260.36 TaxID=1168546 RepID=A0A9P4J873_9PEZI|nr:hypothetical protein K461DRAFT_309312 [Myriangium duriaei CBS 260.36]
MSSHLRLGLPQLCLINSHKTLLDSSLDWQKLTSRGCLHSAFLAERNSETATSSRLVEFAKHLVHDIQDNVLPPSSAAHARLLSFFRETHNLEQGSRFWLWLARQGNEYLSSNVYAAAIELYTDMGKPLPFLEELYASGLKKTSNPFMEYHASPNAKLSTAMSDKIPYGLLNSIARARLIRNDVQSAYMSLDTRLRLDPLGLSTRDFTRFIDSRPISEAYPLYLMACTYHMNGNLTSLATPILAALKSVAARSRYFYTIAPRASIIVLYASACAGAQLRARHLSEVIGSVVRILADPSYDRLSPSRQTLIADTTAHTITMLRSYFHNMSVEPNEACLNTIIHAFGVSARRLADVEACVALIRRLRSQHPRSPTTQLNDVTCRTLLKVSRATSDPSLLYSAWANLVENKASCDPPTKLNAGDVFLYADAALSCSIDITAIREELLRHSSSHDAVEHVISSVTEARAKRDALDRDHSQQPDNVGDDMLASALQLQDDVAVLTARVASGEATPASLRQVPWMTLRSRDLKNASDEGTMREGVQPEAMRALFEIVVNDGANGEESEKNELRYNSWCVINELLAEAEWNESLPRSKDSLPEQLQQSMSVGLSDVFPLIGQTDDNKLSTRKLPGMAGDHQLSVEDVKRLRGLE